MGGDLDQLNQLRKSLTDWPVYRRVVSELVVGAAECCTFDNRRTDCVRVSGLIAIVDLICRISSSTDPCLLTLVVSLPGELLREALSSLSPPARSVMIDAIVLHSPQLTTELEEFIVKIPCEPALPVISSTTESLHLPNSGDWAHRLASAPINEIYDALLEIASRCTDDVLFDAGLDTLFLHCSNALLNTLNLWNIRGTRARLRESGLLVAPPFRLLAALGLAEDSRLDAAGSLFKKAKRRSSSLQVSLMDVTVELDAFVRCRRPGADLLELGITLVTALSKSRDPQSSTALISVIFVHVPNLISPDSLHEALRIYRGYAGGVNNLNLGNGLFLLEKELSKFTLTL